MSKRPAQNRDDAQPVKKPASDKGGVEHATNADSVCRTNLLPATRATMTFELLEKLKKAGASVSVADDVTTVQFEAHNDEAMTEYTAWASSISDPPVAILVLGGKGTSVPFAATPPVILEAWSIVSAYQGLTMAAFAAGALPAVALLAAPPAAPPNIYHAAVAAQKMLQRIQQPGAGFPAINAYGSGTYLCTVQQVFSATIVLIDVSRG
jgi:hypothetical protein